jgi:multicomponent K+:H+ antiporter subunit A
MTMPSASLLSTILIVAAVGALAPLYASVRGRRHAAWAAAGVMLICFALLVPLLPTAMSGEVVIARATWLPDYGINLALRLDALGLMFTLLVLGIGLLVVLYAYYYLPDSDRLGRFYTLLLLFMAAMLGVVLSENLLLLVVFWELTSLTSFLLISYKHNTHDARIAARMALAVTGAGGLALFAGVLMLGHIAGSFELSEVLAAGDRVRAHPHYASVLILILLGVFTKSAQFPFHFWLPNAMAAPTPVSAYLHSATMVKAGVFLLARFYPVLAGTEWWFWIVSAAGAVTLAYAAAIALVKHDFKGLLAYSTISHLGLITLLFGLDTPLSAVAGLFHIINHAIFKASLFMAAGIVDHECGTRDMRRVNGLAMYMPVTATLAIVAAGAMAGVPLLNGFLSKEMFFAETVAHAVFGDRHWLLIAFVTMAGMLSIAYSARFIHDVFFNGEPVDLPRQPHEPPRWMRAPVEVLVALCLLIGVLPGLSVEPLLTAAAGAALQMPPPHFELKLWHGFNLPLAMSAVAFIGGITIYVLRQPLFRLHDALPLAQSRVAFERAYETAAAASRYLLTRLDNGSLQRYLAVLIGSALIYAGWAFVSAPPGPQHGSRLPLDAASIGALAALALGAIGATVLHRQRLHAIVFVSVVGLVVSLTFVRFSAPDLALTQLTVEVVTIVLLLLALFYLPPPAPREDTRGRLLRDGMIALAAGGGMALLSYRLLSGSFETISDYYLVHSVPGGGGSNVVNVILVDFRGFDTFGEITVLTMAALGVHALLDGLRLRPPAVDADGRPWSPERYPLFLQMLMRPLLPLALVVSVYLFLRGHNLPGGGFVAGLVTGVVLILQYLAAGIRVAQERLPGRYPRWLALGLAIATATGLGSWLFGRPFLTSAHAHFKVPVLGEIEIASALLFDLGVYVVVVAVVLMILAEVGRISLRGTEAETR